MVSQKEFDDAMSDLATAEAEIERLRGALRKIVSLIHNLPRSATADQIEQVASSAQTKS